MENQSFKDRALYSAAVWNYLFQLLGVLEIWLAKGEPQEKSQRSHLTADMTEKLERCFVVPTTLFKRHVKATGDVKEILGEKKAKRNPEDAYHLCHTLPRHKAVSAESIIVLSLWRICGSRKHNIPKLLLCHNFTEYISTSVNTQIFLQTVNHLWATTVQLITARSCAH